MRGKTVSWIALGLLGGWLVWGGVGEALAQSITGIWHSHVIEESYKISLGVDSVGKLRKPDTVDEIRDRFNLPQHYGNLIGITGHGDAGVLWYQDELGVIRNAIVPLAAKKLSRIEYTPTSRYREDILP